MRNPAAAVIVTCIIFILILILAFLNFREIEVVDRREEPIEYIVEDTLQFQDSLLNYIIQLRIEHPYTVYSQAIQETHHFTSSLFKYNHNLFGMKFPERRATTAIGVRNGHAVYTDWKMSVIDYALFQMGYMKGLENEEYMKKLYNYAEDSLYINKIRNIRKNF